MCLPFKRIQVECAELSICLRTIAHWDNANSIHYTLRSWGPLTVGQGTTPLNVRQCIVGGGIDSSVVSKFHKNLNAKVVRTKSMKSDNQLSRRPREAEVCLAQTALTK